MKKILAAFLISFFIASVPLQFTNSIIALSTAEGKVEPPPLFVVPQSDRTQRTSYVAGELLVKFRNSASDVDVSVLKGSLGAQDLGLGFLSKVRKWVMPSSRSVDEWVSLMKKIFHITGLIMTFIYAVKNQTVDYSLVDQHL